MFVALLGLFMACRPSISLKITHPADVTVDPNITKIAVVDRINNRHTRKAVAGFLETSQNVDLVRFQVVDGQHLDLAVSMNGPIPNEGMRKLCNDASVKGVLVLHRFNKIDDMDVDRRDEQANWMERHKPRPYLQLVILQIYQQTGGSVDAMVKITMLF